MPKLRAFSAFLLAAAFLGVGLPRLMAQQAQPAEEEEAPLSLAPPTPLTPSKATPSPPAGKYRLVHVPLPPQKPIGKATEEAQADEELAQAEPDKSEPAPIQPTAAPNSLFSLFGNGANNPVASPVVSYAAAAAPPSLVAPRSAISTATTPVPASVLQPSLNPVAPTAPKSLSPLPKSSSTGTENDEDEEEEGPSQPGVEKQVETVDIACVKPEVLALVKQAGQFFKQIPIITSGFRASGRRGSLHRKCMAVDFIVPGVSTTTLAAYMRTLPGAGGVGTYCHTKAVHIDMGEPRNWGYCGFRRTYFTMR